MDRPCAVVDFIEWSELPLEQFHLSARVAVLVNLLDHVLNLERLVLWRLGRSN